MVDDGPEGTSTRDDGGAERAGVDEDVVAAHAAEIDEQGFTVLRDVIDLDLVGALDEDLRRLETELGVVPSDNDFEGAHTVRIYNLLVHGELYRQIPIHPAVLPVVETVLDRGCLISSLSSIGIDPGETAQPIHADDQLIPLERPHVPIVCNTMWALTDFTEANGATRICPGSHRAPTAPEYGTHPESIAAEMSRGSVLVWHGSLWHGGGANTTETRRVGIAMNYCAGFIRQQENQQLGVPPSLVRTFPRRLQRLVGYSTYHGLIGHIDKQDPITLLGDDAEHRMVWDA